MWHERLGKSVDEIASDYGLKLADVHAALAYYFDHRADIDKDMADGQAFAESLRQATPSKLKHKLNGVVLNDYERGSSCFAGPCSHPRLHRRGTPA